MKAGFLPQKLESRHEIAGNTEWLKNIVSSVRQIRSEMNFRQNNRLKSSLMMPQIQILKDWNYLNLL